METDYYIMNLLLTADEHTYTPRGFHEIARTQHELHLRHSDRYSLQALKVAFELTSPSNISFGFSIFNLEF